jgi:lysophospholipase L1-like esterase
MRPVEAHAMARIAIVLGVLIASPFAPAFAQSPAPEYVVLGDSIEFGIGDTSPGDGFGYVPLVAAQLTTFFGVPVEVDNVSVPGATTEDIRGQLAAAVAAVQGHAPVVVSWGGGGNDLLDLFRTPQAAACRQSQSCLGRFNGLLNHIEQTIDHMIRELREAVGPEGVILMRTQYNGPLRSGCPADAAALAAITLEGFEGSVLDRGLNDRIRSVAEKYDAQVVDLYLPFAVNANNLVSADCASDRRRLCGNRHPVVCGVSRGSVRTLNPERLPAPRRTYCTLTTLMTGDIM